MAFKMVDMLETPEEVKQETVASSPVMDNKPHYPYGLSLSLNKETLEKLGVSELPEIGTMIHIMAMAKVTSVNESASEADHYCCVGLQITHMALEDEDTERSYSATLYDKGEAQEDE